MSDFERTQIGPDGKRVIPGWTPDTPKKSAAKKTTKAAAKTTKVTKKAVKKR